MASKTPIITRRSLATGAAWSAPVILVGAAAPAFAASPTRCTNGTMDWGASTTALASGTILPVTGTVDPVYAKITYVRTAGDTGSTATYNLDRGKTAYGSAVGVYTFATTSGKNDLILNQAANSTGKNIAVTISFYSDAAATKPIYVSNLQVPLDDFSSGTSWEGLFTKSLVPTKSYEEAWSVSGTTATGGSITPTITGISSTYGGATTAMISGLGTLASPWYISAQTYTGPNAESLGGNVQTKFSAPVSSVTVTYGSNPTTWAQTNNLSGGQGAGIGTLTLCY